MQEQEKEKNLLALALLSSLFCCFRNVTARPLFLVLYLGFAWGVCICFQFRFGAMMGLKLTLR